MVHSNISSEGGPILIGDADAVRRWRGIEEGGGDYQKSCDAVVRNGIISLAEDLAIWDVGGPGTAFIWRERDLFAVRTWSDGALDIGACGKLVAKALFCPSSLQISVPSGVLVLMWAPEDGSTIRSFCGDYGVPDGDFSMDGTVHFEKMRACTCDVSLAVGEIDGIEFNAIRFQSKG